MVAPTCQNVGENGESILHPSYIGAIVDTREQNPFDLAPMQSELETLNVDDYSVAGLESVIAIEPTQKPDTVKHR